MPTGPADSSEQTRARYPDREGTTARDGVGVHWEAYGHGNPPVLFVPPWSIVHSRCWKMQVPEFARRHLVVTFDPRGNGGSDRPSDVAAYGEDEFARDALAVLDAVEVDSAVVVALSLGAQRALVLANEEPQRVRGLVLIAPSLNLGMATSEEQALGESFHVDCGVDDGWARYNAHSWRRDFPGFIQFFFSEVFNEPHSTKQREDCVGWGLETDAETLIAAEVRGLEPERTAHLLAHLSCSLLVIHGSRDAVTRHAVGQRAAEIAGGRLATLDGAGHCPQARDPVHVNQLLREFIAALPESEAERG